MTNEKLCGIYCIENIVNHKKYIGQSINIKDREYHHFNSLRNGNHHNEFLQEEYNIYKEDNFIFYIVIECEQEELDDYEIAYIRDWNLLDKKYGYNINPGGQDIRQFSELELQKRSQSTKDKWANMDFETRCRIIDSLQNGYQKWFDNLSSEDKVEMYRQRSITLLSRPKDELDEINKRRGEAIAFACKNRSEERKLELKQIYKQSNKIRWDNCSDDVKEALRRCIIRAVRCPQLDMVFESVREASVFTGALSPNIVKVCRGERRYAGKLEDGTKLTWEYVDKTINTKQND